VGRAEAALLDHIIGKEKNVQIKEFQQRGEGCVQDEKLECMD
jgi:hypothetical protein